MDAKEADWARRLGGYTAVAGALCALTGAGLLQASGADLDLALATGDIAGYLVAAAASKSLLVANLTIWIVMVVLMTTAATAMASLSVRRPFAARLAMLSYWMGAPLVIAAFVAWLAVVTQLAGHTSEAAVEVAGALGWFGSRADWVATILIIGVGPTLLCRAGREDWVPTWLARWGIVTGVAGLLTAVALLTGGAGLLTYGFVIVPVGVAWMLAAGIVLLRLSR